MIRLRALGSLDLRDENGRELRSILGQPRRIARYRARLKRLGLSVEVQK